MAIKAREYGDWRIKQQSDRDTERERERERLHLGPLRT